VRYPIDLNKAKPLIQVECPDIVAEDFQSRNPDASVALERGEELTVCGLGEPAATVVPVKVGTNIDRTIGRIEVGEPAIAYPLTLMANDEEVRTSAPEPVLTFRKIEDSIVVKKVAALVPYLKQERKVCVSQRPERQHWLRPRELTSPTE
jgi:antitoxin (DNA-binding transcriptional repressor) of toxin-antitoxin stability system